MSVVQLGDGDFAVPVDDAGGFRPSIVSIQAEINGLRSLVRVTLGNDAGEAVGTASGSIATSARHRLVANATVDALRRLDPAAECLDVEHAQVVRVGASDVAVVTIVFVAPPNEQVVSGSAIVRANQDADAVARSSTRRTAGCPTSSPAEPGGGRRPIVGAWHRWQPSSPSASAAATASRSRPASGAPRSASSGSRSGLADDLSGPFAEGDV